MKRTKQFLDSTFNGAAEMAGRLLCLLGLAAAVMVPPLLLTGSFYHQIRLLAYGGLSFAFAVSAFAWLKITGRMESISAAFEESVDRMDADYEALDSLQRRLDALEESRGGNDFDPWAALELRRKIEKQKKMEPVPPE